MPSKKSFFHKDKEEEKEENPFTKPAVKHKEEDKTSFIYYLKGLFSNFQSGIDRRFDVLASKKIHVRFLRQSKRLIATGYFFLFLTLAFVTTTNPVFFVFFLGASFLMLDYLWKSRRVAWEKKKE